MADVHAGKNWKALFVEGGDPNNPQMEETSEFSATDVGIFSGVLKFADGSRHPALILKTFEHDGGTVGSFVYNQGASIRPARDRHAQTTRPGDRRRVTDYTAISYNPIFRSTSVKCAFEYQCTINAPPLAAVTISALVPKNCPMRCSRSAM